MNEKLDGKLVLIVDDEARMRRFIKMNLELENYRVIEADNGMQAVEQVRDWLPDLVLMDVMMPVMDGFEALALIREVSTVPVIMLTVRSEEDDRVKGLDLGADDYISKPFSPRELASRVRAVLRRSNIGSPVKQGMITVDDYLQIDLNTREVIVGGKREKLRPLEFKLLYHLIQNAGWTVPRETLLAKVWGHEYQEEDNYLRLYITYLRKKVEPNPSQPRYIFTERGVGYRFADFQNQD